MTAPICQAIGPWAHNSINNKRNEFAGYDLSCTPISIAA